MGIVLKAGGLGSTGAAGTPPQFAGSMAQAMEQALNELLAAEPGRDPVSTANTAETRDRRIMFVAIARGIVRHLRDNQDAFDVLRETDDSAVPDRKIGIATQD
jgi:hypothetical protein